MEDLIVEILIAFLCVIGVVCLIKSVYDKIYTEEAEKNFSLRLVLHGDGKTENLEYMLKKAKYLQATYYPTMEICLEDTGIYSETETRYTRRICEELQIQYYGDVKHGREKMDMHQRCDRGGGLPQ